MADALSELSGQPPVDPEAQSVVTDFLDYTEFFPSDLFRSLSLIGKLDQAYQDDAQKVHDLTTVYSKLPTFSQDQRPDPRQIRENVSITLEHALRCRESTFAEASRLCSVSDNLYNRLVGIKAKLEAMPKPPSREATPTPVTPSRTRKAEADRTPRLKLFTDSDKHARHRPHGSGRHRKKPVYIVPGDVLPPMESFSDISSDSEPEPPPRRSPPRAGASPIKLAHEKQTLSIRLPKQKSATPKPPRTPKIRPPGVMGTNVHSQVAGISVSNAMAAMTPPPENPPIGSEWAPWFDLTDWELHLIRRRMKKNANWQPSEVMIHKELKNRGRGIEHYETAKAAADARGETLLDELAHKSNRNSLRMLDSLVELSAMDKELSIASPAVAPDVTYDGAPKQAEKPTKTNGSKKDKEKDRAARHKELELEVQRQIEENMKKVQQENEKAQLLMSGASPAAASGAIASIEAPTSSKKKKTDKKRKRDSEPAIPTPTSTIQTASVTAETALTEPETPASPPKRLRLVAPKPSADEIGLESPTQKSIQIPLAPPGPSNPTAEVPDAAAMVEQAQDMSVELPSALRSTRATRPQKPRTSTPAPSEVASEGKHVQRPTEKDQRTPSVPPKSPLVAASTEQLDSEMLDPLAVESVSPQSSKKMPHGKRTSISLRLPSQKPEAPDIPSASVVEPNAQPASGTLQDTKPRRTSERHASKLEAQATTAPANLKEETATTETEHSTQPVSHKGMTETAASRRTQRRPPPINTSTVSSPTGQKPSHPPETMEPPKSAIGKRPSSLRKSSAPPAPDPIPPKTPSTRKGLHQRRKSTSATQITAKTATSPKTRRASTPTATGKAEEPPPSAFKDADPHEERYCLCRDVSHGAMVACDNATCSVEWFHLGCVGLKIGPRRRESWYCPNCRGENDKELKPELAGASTVT